MSTQIALHLVVADAAEAADWYARVLGATETGRLNLPDGRPLTVEMTLGASTLAVAAEMPDRGMRTPASLGGSPAAFHLQVPDADAAFDRALAAGAVEFEAVHDAFWGERTGQFTDPSGHRWAVDQHLRDVPADELQARVDEMFAPTEPGAAEQPEQG